MEEKANIVIEALLKRRTIKPDKYTGRTVDDAMIQQILEVAHWAPTHGYTEPWRFVVFTEEGKEQLLAQLAEFDRIDHGENEIRYSKMRERIMQSSHIIAIGMQRGENPKIPVIEEVQAVAAAVENMWVAASAMGLGAYWSTGAIGYDRRLGDWLGWTGELDTAMGFLYIGEFNGEWPEGRRITKIDDKVRWVRD